MTKVYSKALNDSIEVGRIISKIEADLSGPTLIFLAGIHGNEPSGIFALLKALQALKQKNVRVRGSIYAISGNLGALEKGERYCKEDLNRLWTSARIKALKKGTDEVGNCDQKEQLQIYNIIMDILDKNEGPFYFADLHTTSSQTIPFITVNDTLLNRKFTSKYPVPLILGIEEYLIGPVLSYINELGYVAFGFEGGQHDEQQSVANHIAFINVTLTLTGSIPQTSDYLRDLNHLMLATMGIKGFFEIFHRHKIESGDHFKMVPDFANFQIVKKGQPLAEGDSAPILAIEKARILMPLYQQQGEDGFFLIRRIAPVFLHVSAFLRKVRFDNFLTLLPGVHWQNACKEGLKVNLKIARFLTKPFFHLLGYRSVIISEEYMLATSREAASKNASYQNAAWYHQ